MIYKTLNVLLLAIFLSYCSVAQHNKNMVESKDAYGNTYKVTYFNKSGQIDSILFVSTTGKRIKCCSSIGAPARPELNVSIEQFVEDNLVYPENFHREGTIIFNLMINESGENEEIRVLKEIPECEECTANAIEVIKKMDAWVPALNLNNKPIPSIYTLSVKFKS